MAGEGFIRQMNETLKYNREMLRMKRHKAFDKTDGVQSRTTKLEDGVEMSEAERQEFVRSLQAEKMREENRRIMVMMISVVITLLVMLTFFPVIKFILKLFS
ncbi:MAG: hypothetical protein KF687_06670 [Cyclobacteriaceae bacterium]|nr:hypothetical protein [Cyclobacteriaceae bacterium]